MIEEISASTAQLTAPEVIFLNVSNRMSVLSQPFSGVADGAEWSPKQTMSAAIRYVRADLPRSEEREPFFDLIAHLQRQKAFSEATFGPGVRTKGVIDHITKKIEEVRQAPGDIVEWIDLVLLALDGAWRAGHEPRAIVMALMEVSPLAQTAPSNLYLNVADDNSCSDEIFPLKFISDIGWSDTPQLAVCAHYVRDDARHFSGDGQYNLIAHLRRQRAASAELASELAGFAEIVLAKISSELEWVRAHPLDLDGWASIVTFSLEGAWRAGFSSAEIALALDQKQSKNERRQWPDWRTVEPGKAIERLRAG